ncbi:hypothetical protein BBO99_00000881 [Phytophthora kernoviae]|uniref:UBP-type domain-containing protein n=2 Tax=Phytophthora kernoviae TaxID=325452 RepID=A0A421FG82_9STRA|nr:hypothetical protein G195_001526 [Phytophthora kernoviae 00238/432]KAG2532687.1 hypothetical protein JM18_000788 [Phytophthora kernoviae]RLN44374.1 hypothetical protein BBI17_000938 [Phytophthora kernoviae]RLN85034.1 hypothetical protein BBO99_00000881 [Phytophthora kernoviae]
MFQIRVQAADECEEEGKAEDFDGAMEEEEVEETLQDASFLAGNPQVRVTTGKLRFYRTDKPYAASAGSNNSSQQLPNERSALVCVVTVPSHMSPVEILEFLASFREDIALVRILKDPERSNCMVLMQFNSQERADQFFLDHNGKYFNSIEQERCKIVFVRSIEFDSVLGEDHPDNDGLEEKHAAEDQVASRSPRSERRASSAQMRKMFPPPPAGMTEIPTCAVCLDRLDASASGILTTLHGDIGSACEACGSTEHLWICLICGHVGCGRYSGEHAKQHYQDTLHTYSLELETQRVWDYAGDGYVHRLILNKQDGKFVEFPSPNTMSGERSQTPPTTSAEEEEMEHGKLEKLAVEYNFLLKSQLEEQRLYYERLLARVDEGESRQLRNAHEHERKHLKKANATLEEKTKKLEEELTFVRELNKSLIENQKQWKERVRALEEDKVKNEQETALRIGDLEGQVRDLMFYLDTQSKVEQSAHREEILGHSPMAPKVTSSLRRNGFRIRKSLEVCDLLAHAQQVVRTSPPLRVLGLDVNTNSTGFAVVTERGRASHWGHIPTTQFASADVLHIGGAIDEFLESVQSAEQEVEWVVGIEAFLRMFRSGRFHNAGIFQLAQLNGIVSFACWKRFDVLPLHTHPSAARGFFGLSAPASSSSSLKKNSIKHQVMNFLETQEPELTQTMEQDAQESAALPSFERTRTGALADSAFDIADAYVIAAYTRCAHFQQQLVQQHPQLVERFSTRYMELTDEAAAKTKKSSPELQALEAMSDHEKLAYTSDLFAFGAEQWFKEHNNCFKLQEHASKLSM